MSTDKVLEAARTVPVAGICDVVVCGGGPAGVAAALRAADCGARVTLLEAQGCLGGVWTSGLLSYVLDAGGDLPFGSRSILSRLIERLEANGGKRPGRGTDSGPESAERALPWVADSFLYDVELMKLILEQWCGELGIRVRLHTRVVAALSSDDAAGDDAAGEGRRLTAVVTESASGREAWRAAVFIDTTGDGDLAAQAGCGFDVGHPETGALQPMTLMALVTGIRFDAVAPYVSLHHRGSRPAKELLLDLIRRGGHNPSYTKPTLFHVRDDLFAFMGNHVFDAAGTNADDLSAATIAARAELFAIQNALRAADPQWRDFRIVQTAAHIGVREARRIHGRYSVDAADLVAGTKHADAVCRVYFPVDIHNHQGWDDGGVRSKPYDIPARALMARDYDNLLMAGRCISGDFWAHASYRVTGNAVALGDAAGALAATAAAVGRPPHAIPWDDARERVR